MAVIYAFAGLDWDVISGTAIIIDAFGALFPLAD
jgi:hypothetical protein